MPLEKPDALGHAWGEAGRYEQDEGENHERAIDTVDLFIHLTLLKNNYLKADLSVKRRRDTSRALPWIRTPAALQKIASQV